MKLKSVRVLLIWMISISFISSFASADPINDLGDGLKSLGEGVYNILEGPLEVIVGDVSSSEWFLAKVLFLLIIFTLVWVTLDKVHFFGEHSWALWLVSISVSVLSIRWIQEEGLIAGMLLPYSAFGVAVTAGIPFILFFFFVKDYTAPIRKVSWLFFAVIFIGLWYVRRADLGVAVSAYPITAVLAVLMFMMDGTIARWKAKIDIEKANIPRIRRRIEELRTELDQLQGTYAGPSGGDNYTSIYSTTTLKGARGWHYDEKVINLKIKHLMRGL